MPCNNYLKFSHSTKNCTETTKWNKCSEAHSTNKCPTTLPPKCSGCGSEDHQAWSFKCPKRPTKPITRIPNLPVKTLNNKSDQIKDNMKMSRIHSPITLHDIIINSYVQKLNKPKNINREELIERLRKRFMADYRIDTTVTFVGNNWIYILMFDMELDNFESHTETIPGSQVAHIQQRN
ncbi:unnamed protein product [Psylliodes chrysocephalus]|uniref:Uncharacterized protein n=1 Tax=Psylliodes chrysocephalus TaxID=3402493 RepID=A0A9P0CZN6_9CUCU|nr:unnamed protein product [Psylliodes chrysocephala]